MFRFSLFVFLFSINSFAGGDTLGNGGGLAELQLTKIWNSLDKEIKICLDSQNRCSLENAELDLANAVIDSRKNGKRGEVWFEASKSEKIFMTRSELGSTVYFNQTHLYLAPSEPVPFSTLMSYALQAQFYQMKVPENVALTASQKISRYWQTKVKKIQGIYNKQPAYFIFIEAPTNSAFSYEIYLEVPSKTFDLTDLFTENLPCKVQRGDLVLTSGAFVSESTEILIRGNFQFKCNQTVYEGQYEVHADFEGRYKPRISIYRIRSRP